MALANGLGICRGRSTLGMVRRSQNVGLGQARAAPVKVASGRAPSICRLWKPARPLRSYAYFFLAGALFLAPCFLREADLPTEGRLLRAAFFLIFAGALRDPENATALVTTFVALG